MSFITLNFDADFIKHIEEDQYDYDAVNFDDIVEEQKKTVEIYKIPEIEYDKTTIEKYRVFRLRKMDPIAYIETEDDYAFQFKYIWDPYTGERKNTFDQYGPLFFDPDILIKHYFTKILSKLWVQPSDEKGGFYEGYYDDGAGAGEDFFVAGRGHHPEWYLFRLPIIDCYLTKDHNKQYITFGPKLTDDEVLEIDMLANKRPDNFKQLFGHSRPSLVQMKILYDQAISKTPTIANSENQNNSDDLQISYNLANRQAIDKLVKISSTK